MFRFLNDKWLLIIGIPFLGLVMPLVFNKFSLDFLLSEGYRNAVMSTLTTISIWLGVRGIVIFLWNRYPWEKYPAKHLIYEIVMVTAYTSVIGYLSYVIARYTNFVELDPEMSVTISAAITLIVTYLITCIHEAWFFYTQWNVSLVKAQALEKENIQSQYETLKSQINPHFLFNTLNTLTTLIEEDSQTAVNYVGKTSDFLRSILSMKDREVISLQDEIKIIETFYHLQKERFGENLRLQINLSPRALEKNIPPLSLQMLVENAIKHNVISAEKPLTIVIDEKPNGTIEISNNLQKKKQEHLSNGIGLQNIRRRYHFLSDKKIDVREDQNTFSVALPLLED
ncbi:MAG: sensor histidine kinase [Bacteroidota bacterium]